MVTMQKAMTKITVKVSKSRTSEGIDYRGHRHIIPTQAAWAYVNDIKYNYYNIFLTKNGKILYVKYFYCNYIVLFYLYPLRSTFFQSAKIHQINLSQFAKGEPETLLFLE